MPLTPRQEYRRSAMIVLMSQHPNATMGWIAEMSKNAAQVMMDTEEIKDTSDPSKPFACDVRIYAEDEAEYRDKHK